MLKKLHHSKNELFEIEYFEDAGHTIPFNFQGVENIYIALKDGDVSPLTALKDEIRKTTMIYVPYIPNDQRPLPNNVKTLNDITPDFSKYIPKDNAILFLSDEELSLEDYDEYQGQFFRYITKEVNSCKIESYPQDVQICGLYYFGTEKQCFHIHESV